MGPSIRSAAVPAAHVSMASSGAVLAGPESKANTLAALELSCPHGLLRCGIPVQVGTKMVMVPEFGDR